MFRFLKKYIGKYRVLAELDLDTNDIPRNVEGEIDESYDDLYIPCRRGYIKNTAEYTYLCWFSDTLKTGRGVKREFDEHNIPIYKYEETDEEVLIWFDDKYISKVASIVKPITKGKNIDPFFKKIDYSIPEQDLKEYLNVIKDFPTKEEKMLFVKNANKSFAKVIIKKKGKRFDIKKEQKGTGLPYKEFVHFIGLWEEYIKHLKNEYRKLHK